MKMSGASQAGALFAFVCLTFLVISTRAILSGQFIRSSAHALPVTSVSLNPFSNKLLLTKEKIAGFFGNSAKIQELPTEVDLSSTLQTNFAQRELSGKTATTNGTSASPSTNANTINTANTNGASKAEHVRVRYTIDPQLQKSMESLFESFGPDYGAFVAMDARSGRILSMVSYSRSGNLPDHLALRATFPSASVFKVVTAAAAIEKRKISANTVIPFNGRNHTLYRGQILKSNVTRWTRYMTFKEAFAQSVNTVFGRIGAFTVGADALREFADRFGFNRRIESDLHVQEGRAWIPNDSWGLAESASGFTRDNTMSPLQGALIAASVVNRGVMMEPFLVEKVTQLDGSVVYQAEPKVSSITMDPSTAHEIRTLMNETVLHGTSRGAFRGFFRKGLVSLDVGGKTGSLTGTDPHGKVDWFVGFADSGPHQIAVAALTIHEKQWRVKSSYLARRAIENYFRKGRHEKTVAFSSIGLFDIK